ncbi:hypothetical protein GJ699_22220 [Duganella sp. FT80W]|uniref:J domain-containing protein n=1 Tax=Duganella guangzhouensis TaxID=2666084 RepID=A0A6I2L8X7_9BURK|nr:J domain-containing protein [Duganella guangzhouensis]MRW92719.1 hypothetical protein [Duganella guangzhouensis]
MSCWEILGIAITTDAATIKKAYASRLKVTRPDEDAEGYQRLRDAYQQALQQSKATPQPAPSESASPAPPPVAEAPEMRAEQFINIVFQHWDIEDQSSLMVFWPELKAKLDRVPLNQISVFSNIAASMVLQYPKLPVEFVEQLGLHFEWKRDFTLARNLGAGRATDLLARLERVSFELGTLRMKRELEQRAAINEAKRNKEAEEQRITDIEQRFANAAAFARLLGSATPNVSKLHAFLAGPCLRQNWNQLTAEHCEVLDIRSEAISQGADLLAQAGRMRSLLSLTIACVAAVLNIILGSGHDYALPLLLVILLSYFFPVGYWHESLKNYLYPQRIADALFTQGVRDPKFARITSVMACFYAMGICLMINKTLPDEAFPIVAIVAVALLLFVSWSAPREANQPDIEITPAIFCLCLTSCWTLGLKGATLVSVSAFWHAWSYAAKKQTWLWSGAIIWLLTSVGLYFYYDGMPIAAIGIGVPWLLSTLYKKESLGYALAAMGVSVIYLPTANSALQMGWTGVVALAWITASAGMRSWSRRMVPQELQLQQAA